MLEDLGLRLYQQFFFVVFSFSIQMAVVKKILYGKDWWKLGVFCVCPLYYSHLIAFLTSVFLLLYCFALAAAYLSDSLTNRLHWRFNMLNQLLHAVLTGMGCQSITCKLLSTCNYCVTCVKMNAFFIMCYPWRKRRVSSFQALLLSVMFLGCTAYKHSLLDQRYENRFYRNKVEILQNNVHNIAQKCYNY